MASKIRCCSQRRGKKILSSADWCNIDIDIFECIQKKMLLPDMLVCRAVCTSWRSLTESCITSSSKSPILMLCKQHFLDNLSGQEDYVEPSSGRCLLNPATKELYKLSSKSRELLREMTFCVGSSHGWMLLKTKHKTCFFMLHASFGTGILIPFSRCLLLFNVVKAVLSADPILSNDNHCIMAIYRDSRNVRKLAFGKCGDQGFRSMFDEVDEYLDRSYEDIISFKHCVYAVKDNGLVRAWDCNILMKFRGRNREYCIPRRVFSFLPYFNPGKELKFGSKLHLVESRGDLLLVSKIGSRTTSLFQVYKLDFDEVRWVDMESLDDRVLFIFVNQSFSLLAGDCPKLKRNSIYFEDEDGSTGSSGTGVYVFNYDVGCAQQILL